MKSISLIFNLFLFITPVVPQEGMKYPSAGFLNRTEGGGGGGNVPPRPGQEFVKTLRVCNGGPWGSWRFKDFCPKGSYAIGYEMKIESKQCGGDDTSMNGVRLICGSKAGRPDGSYASSDIGQWGDWKGEVRCLPGQVIVAFRLQVERPQGGGDDTAANSMMVKCRNFGSSGGLNERKMGTGYGFWGKYGEWSETCTPNTAVCGIQTKIEKPQGSGDDTALNDVELFCCK